eukprot:m51a1_g9714 hypothetical protein (625) ;mRNA; f:1412215-1418949
MDAWLSLLTVAIGVTLALALGSWLNGRLSSLLCLARRVDVNNPRCVRLQLEAVCRAFHPRLGSSSPLGLAGAQLLRDIFSDHIVPTAHEGQLWACWLLRENVIPRLTRVPDLVSLALASPPQALAWAPSNAAEDACGPDECDDEVAELVRSGRTPEGLARWLCAHAAARVHPRVPALDRALALAPWTRGACPELTPREALRLACFWGLEDSVRRLSRAPFSLGAADARARNGAREPLGDLEPSERACGECLLVACARGHAGVVRALAKLYGLGAADATLCALCAAAANGHADVVRALCAAPYRASAPGPRLAVAAALACAGGHAEALEALARPPLCLRCGSARDGRALLAAACRCGRAGVPFALGPADADASDALRLACGSDAAEAADAVRALAEPPYSVAGRASPGAVAALLADACARGAVDVARALLEEPYGAAGAVDWDGARALLEAVCEGGHCAVLRALSVPPFARVVETGLAEMDPAATLECVHRLLRLACCAGSAPMVRTLARPPYCADGEHARHRGNAILRAACSRGHCAVVRALARPPYGLCGDDARAEDGALLAACRTGHADVVRALAREPYALGERDARAARCRAVHVARQRRHAEVLEVLSGPPYNTPPDSCR